MMKELHLSIVSPEKSVFDGEVKIVTLPGTVTLVKPLYWNASLPMLVMLSGIVTLSKAVHS